VSESTQTSIPIRLKTPLRSFRTLEHKRTLDKSLSATTTDIDQSRRLSQVAVAEWSDSLTDDNGAT